MAVMEERGRLEELYRRHAQAVFRFAYGLARDRSQAEDIVAETFARILTRAEGIESRTARAYLFATARNVFLDGRRSAARQARLAGEMAHEPATIAPNEFLEPDDLRATGALREGHIVTGTPANYPDWWGRRMANDRLASNDGRNEPSILTLHGTR